MTGLRAAQAVVAKQPDNETRKERSRSAFTSWAM